MSLNKTMRSTIKLFPLILLLTLSFFVFSTKQASAIDYTCGSRTGYCLFGSIEFKASNLNYESGDYTWTCGKVSCPLNYTIIAPAEDKPVYSPDDTVLTIGDETPEVEPAQIVEVPEEESSGYVYDRNKFAKSRSVTVTATNGNCDCPKCGELLPTGAQCDPGRVVNRKTDANGKTISWRCVDDCGNISVLCSKCKRPKCGINNSARNCKEAAVCDEGDIKILNSDKNGCNWVCILSEEEQENNNIKDCEKKIPLYDGREFVNCGVDLGTLDEVNEKCGQAHGGIWNYRENIDMSGQISMGSQRYYHPFSTYGESSSSGEDVVNVSPCPSGSRTCTYIQLNDFSEGYTDEAGNVGYGPGGSDETQEYTGGWNWYCCSAYEKGCPETRGDAEKRGDCTYCYAMFGNAIFMGSTPELITTTEDSSQYTSFVAPTTVGMGYFSSSEIE